MALACLTAAVSLSSGFLEVVTKVGCSRFVLQQCKQSIPFVYLQRVGFKLSLSGSWCLWREPGCLVLK